MSKALEQRYGDWLEIRHIVEKFDGGIHFISNSDLDKQLEIFVCEKKKVLNMMFKEEILDNYFGNTEQENSMTSAIDIGIYYMDGKGLTTITPRTMINLFNIGFTKKLQKSFWNHQIEQY